MGNDINTKKQQTKIAETTTIMGKKNIDTTKNEEIKQTTILVIDKIIQKRN